MVNNLVVRRLGKKKLRKHAGNAGNGKERNRGVSFRISHRPVGALLFPLYLLAPLLGSGEFWLIYFECVRYWRTAISIKPGVILHSYISTTGTSLQILWNGHFSLSPGWPAFREVRLYSVFGTPFSQFYRFPFSGFHQLKSVKTVVFQTVSSYSVC